MNNKYVAPIITCVMLLVFDTLVLIQGIVQRETERITLAVLAFVGIVAYIYYLLLCHNTKRLKPVRVRARK